MNTSVLLSCSMTALPVMLRALRDLLILGAGGHAKVVAKRLTRVVGLSVAFLDDLYTGLDIPVLDLSVNGPMVLSLQAEPLLGLMGPSWS